MERSQTRRSWFHHGCTTTVLLFVMGVLAANLWPAFEVDGESLPEQLENKGKTLKEKVEEMKAIEETEEESSQGSSVDSRWSEENSIKLQCEAIQETNLFTIDKENVELLDRLLDRIENEVHPDPFGNVTVCLELRWDPPLNPEEVLRCISHYPPETFEKTPTTILPVLLELTLDVGKRLVRCQGSVEVFAKGGSFLEVFDKNGKLATLETVENEVTEGMVTVAALLPPGNDILRDMRGVFCTLHFAKYSDYRDDYWGILVTFWRFLYNYVISMFPWLLLPRRLYLLWQQVERQEWGVE